MAGDRKESRGKIGYRNTNPSITILESSIYVGLGYNSPDRIYFKNSNSVLRMKEFLCKY